MKVADYLNGGIDLLRKHPLEMIAAGLIALVMFCTVVLTGPACAGLVYIALKARRGETPEILDLFKGFDHFVNSLFVGVMLLAVMVGSTLLAMMPLGSILATVFSVLSFPIASALTMYAMPLVVDKGLGWKPALNASLARATKDLSGHLVFGVLGYVVVLPFIGLPIFVGAITAAYADASAELVGLASKG